MKKLLSTVVAGALVASTASLAMAATTYNTSSKKVQDINTVYYLKGDNAKLNQATETSQNVKHIVTSSKQKVSGFEDIDIVVDGSVGEIYTLVFGVSPVAGSTARATLAGAPKDNNDVEWIPLANAVKCKSVAEYGDLYQSSDRGVSVKCYKQGITTFVKSQQLKQAAGVKIEFDSIGKTDLYSVKTIEISGAEGDSTKTFKLLCRNKHVESGDTSVVDGASLNDETGYYEVNTLKEKFHNGKVLAAAAVKAMRDSGNKYAIIMSNGVTILVDKISKETADSAVTLKTNANVDATLRDRYAEAAGGSIVTFSVDSGFTNDTVTYAIDLNSGDSAKGMSHSQQKKWEDGKKVYCYLVDKANLETLAHGSAADGIIDSAKMLPCEMKNEIIHVKTNPTIFDASKQMMMFTLKELDIAKLPAVSGISVPTSSEAEVVAPVVSAPVTSAPVVDEIKDTTVVPEPAPTGRAVTQTGASDVVALAIALATVSMAAAGTVAFKKAR